VKNGSAEILGFEDARARLRASDIDPKNFPSVGSFLEAVRDRQGLSIATVSDRTHVKASYIEAIERMLMNGLPSRPYAIGFVRVYAEALGLDPAPVVERFKSETGIAAGKRAQEAAAPVAAPSPAERAEPSRLSLVAVLAILAFMIWCAYVVTRPGPEAVKRPLKLDGVPLAEEVVAPNEAPAPAAPPPVAESASSPSADKRAEIIPARLTDRIDPVYPPACEGAAAAVETVELAFTVTPDGAVVSERVVKSSNSCFDRAALNAVKRWRFAPKTMNGAPKPAYEEAATVTFVRPS
jgi:TonB family protein